MQEDFKYVMHDLSTLYVGAAYTYSELMNLDDAPFKFRSMVNKIMMKEVDGNTKISDHIFFIDPDGLSYMTYKHLKARFKMNVFHREANKGQGGYVSETHTIEEIRNDEFLQNNKDTIFVEELIIGKLNLAGLQL